MIEGFEENLGIPLTILFDILTNNKELYEIRRCYNGYIIRSENVNSLEYDENHNEFILCSWSDWGCDFSVKTKEFEKAWFLSKERAEKELKKLQQE